MTLKDRRLEVSVVARRLNVGTSTVYRLIKHRKLMAAKLGISTGVRVYESSVVAFEESRKKEALELDR